MLLLSVAQWIQEESIRATFSSNNTPLIHSRQVELQYTRSCLTKSLGLSARFHHCTYIISHLFLVLHHSDDGVQRVEYAHGRDGLVIRALAVRLEHLAKSLSLQRTTYMCVSIIVITMCRRADLGFSKARVSLWKKELSCSYLSIQGLMWGPCRTVID